MELPYPARSQTTIAAVRHVNFLFSVPEHQFRILRFLAAQEAQMPTYRAFFLDRENHITERREIEAESEAEAINTAKQWLDGKAIEIWCGPVLVETLKAVHKG